MTQKVAYSPEGYPIVGTYETVSGLAYARVTRNAYGEVGIEYEGETEIWWDGQKTEEDHRGVKLYVDAAYNVVAEDEIEWREVEDAEVVPW